MKQQLKEKTRLALVETRRLGWALCAIVALFLVLPNSDPQSSLALLRFKVGLVMVAVVVAHLVRSQLLPYVKLGEALNSGDVGKALGSALVVAALYAAIILGLTLGL